MSRQFEVADDLRAQQAHDVGILREAVPGEDLARAGGAADPVVAFENDDLLAGAGQVGRGDQAVVACADDDRVEPGGAHFLFHSGS